MNPEASSTPDPSDDADTEAAAARTEAEDPGAADLCLDTTDADVQNRLWLKAVVPLLQLRNHETDPMHESSSRSTRCISPHANGSLVFCVGTCRATPAETR